MNPTPKRPVAIPRLEPGKALPPYHYVPGRGPHPTRHPEGHLRGRPSRRPVWPRSDAWAASTEHRYAIDLFNHGFYWEAHEAWEELWHLAPKGSAEGIALKALIQTAAALLKAASGKPDGAERLAASALMGLEAAATHGLVRGGLCLGLDLIDVAQQLDAWRSAPGTAPRPTLGFA